MGPDGEEAALNYTKGRAPCDKEHTLRMCEVCGILEAFRLCEKLDNPYFKQESDLSHRVDEKDELRKMQEQCVKNQGHGFDPRFVFRCPPCICRALNCSIVQAQNIARRPRAATCENRRAAFNDARKRHDEGFVMITSSEIETNADEHEQDIKNKVIKAEFDDQGREIIYVKSKTQAKKLRDKMIAETAETMK